MHQALYRKWRPQTFDEVYGQEHITSVLRYEAETHAFSHAYLFCGSRGTGKTTCAKILAKVVNCEHPVNGNPCGVCDACRAIDSGAATDVLEMDAASNNGVEDIRDIRDEVVYSPSSLRFRVYIIDEVHMLSISAFNALLKTLEEPPEHVVFILATTEMHKLPATIISRCQRFDFRRIATDVLMERLMHIAREEGIVLQTDAARMIARLAQGGMRDAISLLELCAGGGREVTVDAVADSVGLTGRDSMLRTVGAIADRDYETLFGQIAEVVRSSKDILVFWQDLISVYRDILVVKTTKNAAAYLDLTDHELERLSLAASRFRKETLTYHCKLLEEAYFSMQRSNAVKRVVAELTLLRMCDESLDQTSDALLSRIARLEERALTGGFASEIESGKAAPLQKPAQEKAAPMPVPSVPEAKRENLAVQSSSQKRVMKPIRNWMEVVERVSRSSEADAGFVKLSRGYTTEDGSVVVHFDSDFSLLMISRDEPRDRLRMAISSVLRREIGDRMLKMEVAGKPTEANVIDEILDIDDENGV